MIPTIETERLILRAFIPSDVESMFELDSNPLVHKYLGENPVTSIEQCRKIIESVINQYETNGIGRWVAIEKVSGNFIGWSGLKYITEPENNHVNFYDVGYRLIPQFWGKGYATESAMASLKFGFEQMNLSEIIGTAHVDNIASRKALEKCGLRFIEKFKWKHVTCDWLKITKDEWEDHLKNLQV